MLIEFALYVSQGQRLDHPDDVVDGAHVALGCERGLRSLDYSACKPLRLFGVMGARSFGVREMLCKGCIVHGCYATSLNPTTEKW